MEIEISIQFDEYTDTSFYLKDANGYVIFNSTSDYGYNDEQPDQLPVDVCGKWCL
jgi:hypothetical protein